MVVMGYVGNMVDCLWIDLTSDSGTGRGAFDESELKPAAPYIDYDPNITY